jgi:AraC-like DNA-binding protein
MKRGIEIVLQDDVQAILDSFAYCFSIRILFYSPDTEFWKFGAGESKDSLYCRLIMGDRAGERLCIELDKTKLEEAARERKMISYRCHAGLMESIMPIYAEKHLLGYVMIGQFRTDASIPEGVIRDLAGTYDVEVLHAAYKELPLIPETRLSNVLHLFSTLVNYIVSQHLVTARLNAIVEEILDYVSTHIDQPITLEEASERVHRSATTITHLFKKSLGKSFKQAVIDMKLERAEEYMRTRRGITVQEVARMVGYDDAYHFSNLFQKHRRCRPTTYLKQFKK